MEKLALSTRNIKIPDLHFSIGSDASLYEEKWNLKHSRVVSYRKCHEPSEYQNPMLSLILFLCFQMMTSAECTWSWISRTKLKPGLYDDLEVIVN